MSTPVAMPPDVAVSAAAGGDAAGDAVPEVVPPLGRAAATGFLLMSGQSLITRVLTFGAQIVMARYLNTYQFGLFGIAVAVMSYANLSQQIGVREVLISRARRFDVWQNVGWWVATTCGVLSGLLILAAAPITAWWFEDRTLFWMLVILAVGQPLFSMTLVQEARVQIDMRFRFLAAGQLVQGGLTPVLQVGLALAKVGAYAFVIPRGIVAAARWWMFGRAVPVKIRRDPQFNRWKYILIPGSMVLLNSLAFTIPLSVPVLVLGKSGGAGEAGAALGKELAGVFNFAFNLSLQAIMLLATQIDNVLFPTLARMMGDPQRQRAALMRASRALNAVLAPVCFFQLAAARPLVLLVFGDKWEPAVIPFQIMSLGLLGAGAYAPAQSLLQAQSRFGKKLFIAMLWAVVGATIGTVSILLAPPEYKVAVAGIGLGIGYTGYGLHNCIAATKPIGGGIGDALRIVAAPVLISMVATALAMLASYYTPAPFGQVWAVRAVHIAVTGVVGGIVYILLLRFLARGVWNDLMHAGAPIIRRVRRFIPIKALRHHPETPE